MSCFTDSQEACDFSNLRMQSVKYLGFAPVERQHMRELENKYL